MAKMSIKQAEKLGSKDKAIAYLLEKCALNSKSEAFKELLKRTPKETDLQSAILKSIRSLDNVFFWKDSASPFQQRGIPDICIIKDGQFIGFEVKRPFGIGKLTEVQKDVHDQIRKAGGQVYVISFPSEAESILTGGKKP